MLSKLALSTLALALGANASYAQIDFDHGGGIPPGYLTMPQDHTYVAPPVIIPLPTPVVTPDEPKAQAEWTIMVFVNGKNDLEQFAMRDINEMEMVGSSSKLNIVVEMGRIEGYDSTDGDWKGVRRYLVQKDDDTSKISSPVVEDLGMADMGDYRTLVDFAKWAKAKYPAKRTMLIVWNHGSGWTKGGRPRIVKGISYDEQSGNHITTPQLGAALAAIGKVDVYGSDACLMQMPEVAYEIKDYAEYIVGSEETEPGDGYTYNTFLGPVAARPTMSAYDLAKVTVDAYSDHYDSQDTGYTQSFIKSSELAGLLTKVNEFAYAITQAGEKQVAQRARDAAINFAVEENRDLHHFASLVVANSQNAEVKAKGQALMTHITSALVKHHRSKDDPGGWWTEPKDFSTTRGIAIYIPSGATGAGYADLKWAQYSNWDEFLVWLNQREPQPVVEAVDQPVQQPAQP